MGIREKSQQQTKRESAGRVSNSQQHLPTLTYRDSGGARKRESERARQPDSEMASTTTISIITATGELMKINLTGDLTIKVTRECPGRTEDMEVSVAAMGGISSRVESVDREGAVNTISRGWRRLVEMRRARQTLEEMRVRMRSVESEPPIERHSLSDRRFVSEIKRQAAMEPLHGLARGNVQGNVRGSFWISGETRKVLSKGVPFGPNGDQRWGKGMDADEYCPTMTIIGVGPNRSRHCVCHCNLFLI